MTTSVWKKRKAMQYDVLVCESRSRSYRQKLKFQYLFFLGFTKHIHIPQVVFGWDPILSAQDSSLVVLIQSFSVFQHNPNPQVTNPSLLYRNVQSRIGRTAYMIMINNDNGELKKELARAK